MSDGSFGIWGVHPDNDPDYVDPDPDACPFCGGTGRAQVMDDVGDGLAYEVCSACQGTGFDE